MKTKSRNFSSSALAPGFTLVELMVTIVIIVVLVSFVFLGASRLKESTNRAVSTANLKKLQLANGLYSSDHNGRYASTYTKNSSGSTGNLWDRSPDFLDNYVGPSQPTSGNSQESRILPEALDPIAYKAKKSGYDTLKASYGMVAKINYTGSSKDVDSSYRNTELTAPHLTAAFVTSVNWLVQYGGRNSWKGVEGKVNAPMIAYRHRGKALVAYYDGHVGAITMRDMEGLDRRGGKNNSFWKGRNGTP